MDGILMRNLQLPSKRPSKIGFFSPLAGAGTNMGYGYAAVELIKSWQRMGIPVWTSDREAPVAFNFGQPHFYERVEGALNIGYTPWESTGVPRSWIQYMNKMDEIWTTCNANAEWYRNSGVRVPVRVLPHGINREHYPLKRRTRSDDGVVNLLHIGEPTPRKGGRLVYEAFAELFANDPRASLTIKGTPRTFEVDPDIQNITVISERLNQEDMRDLYLNHDAMIYPTNGEGFGLIPFQAAATGMPTAVTNWSGPMDYMSLCYPIKVEKLIKADYAPHEGMWAKPCEVSLRLWMQGFVESPNYFFSNAYRKAHRMHEKWSWDQIGKLAVEYISSSLN